MLKKRRKTGACAEKSDTVDQYSYSVSIDMEFMLMYTFGEINRNLYGRYYGNII